MAFNFDLIHQPWRPLAVQRAIGRWDALLSREDTWPCYVLSNHDQPRHATRFALNTDASAKVAAALLLTLRGTPFIYYGEEIGMQDVTVGAADTWDYAFSRRSRDASRTPMHWSENSYGGFSPVRPWLPLGDHRERNVEHQLRDRRSVLAFYRELIWVRRETPALVAGNWRALIDEPMQVLVYVRELGQARALVVLNFSSENVRVRLDHPLPQRHWTPRLSTRRSDCGWTVYLHDDLQVGAYEATIYLGA
jgi:alpha-glucosidase